MEGKLEWLTVEEDTRFATPAPGMPSVIYQGKDNVLLFPGDPDVPARGPRRLFAGKTILAPSQEAVPVLILSFSDGVETIACTSGPLADCLMDRLRSAATSLKEALGHWLIPRHATQLENAVRAGKILLWIRLADADADAEWRAYQSLLAHSSDVVGVHDLVLSNA